MTASGDDQPTRKRWRLVPIPVLTGVLAVIGAVVLAVFLSGCRGPSGGPGPTASSRSAAPSTWSDLQGHRHRARRQVARRGGGGSGHPHRLRHQLRRRHGVGDRRLDAHRHRHRARRQEPGRGGGGPGHPHRLRHQLRRRHGVGDRRLDAHRHRHRARRQGPVRGGGGPGHPHRLRHQRATPRCR